MHLFYTLPPHTYTIHTHLSCCSNTKHTYVACTEILETSRKHAKHKKTTDNCIFYHPNVPKRKKYDNCALLLTLDPTLANMSNG